MWEWLFLVGSYILLVHVAVAAPLPRSSKRLLSWLYWQPLHFCFTQFERYFRWFRRQQYPLPVVSQQENIVVTTLVYRKVSRYPAVKYQEAG
jgi:hypothetical protein